MKIGIGTFEISWTPVLAPIQFSTRAWSFSFAALQPQRGCGTEPKVAQSLFAWAGPPWENGRKDFSTSKRLWPGDWSNRNHNLFEVVNSTGCVPRVGSLRIEPTLGFAAQPLRGCRIVPRETFHFFER